jgi:DnaJ like chaperone protein
MEIGLVVVGVLAVFVVIGWLVELSEKKAAKQSNPALGDVLQRSTQIQNLQNVVTDYTKKAFEGIMRGDPSWCDIESAEQWNRHRQRFIAEASSFERDYPGGLEPSLAQINVIHDEAIAVMCKHLLQHWLENHLMPNAGNLGRMNVVLVQACQGGGASMEYLLEAKEAIEALASAVSQYQDLRHRYSSLAPMNFSNSDAAIDSAGTMLESTRAVIAELRKVINGSASGPASEPTNTSAGSSASRSSLNLYAPYVRLGMALARADGDLASEEVVVIIRYMMQTLDMPPNDKPGLQAMMKEPIATNLGPLVEEAIALGANRNEGRSALMSLLVAVAEADGVVHREEVKFLREVARLAGWDDAQFESFAKQHKLSLSDPWEVLGVPTTATWSEVRKAWKTKMADYHPDKVAQMPPEFQMLAHQKCTEFNGSLEAIKAHLGA